MDDVEVMQGGPRIALAELRRRIAACLARTPVIRAVLFGSFARGDADFASDVDLLLIEETADPFPERGRAHRGLFRLGVGMDLLVYTPQEYERLRREGNSLVERIEHEGVVVYERSEG